MIHNEHVDYYINLWKSGKIKFNKERIMLVEYLEKYVLSRSDLYFDDEMINNCIAFGEKWYFPLAPFQKFLIAFVFLFFKKNNRRFYRKHLWLIGRGAGKNGLISVITNFLISQLHGIEEYNISIVANSEEQAKTSFDETYNVIGRHKTLQDTFSRTKTQITAKGTDSILKFRTSNGDTKDGLRDGAVVFDEIHRYENNKDVQVHVSGLGKKPNPREFYIGTDGYTRGGFLDTQKKIAMRVLKGEIKVNAIFPFICKLNKEEEVDNPDNWELANPMLSEPRGEYAEGLYETIMEEYEDLEYDSSNREEFMTKRMNFPVADLERSVTSWEKIEATNQRYNLSDFKHRECMGSVDYASIRDFAACGLLFVEEDKFIMPKELTQQFCCKPFVDKHYAYSRKKSDGNNNKENRKFAPIREWESQGLLTVLKDDTMNPHLIVKWFVDRRKEGYLIKKVVGDNFRMELLKPLFEAEGFEVEVIRNPDAASALLSPKIELAFDKENIIFGDSPIMRWNTNNVLVEIQKNGNKFYKKKEPVKRKTDGFMMFLFAVWASRDLPKTNTRGFKAMSKLRF